MMDNNIYSKIYSDFNSFQPLLEEWKNAKETIVFTNGCFDILHHGHINSLMKSAGLGTKLIVGLNSDSSVKKLKGNNRPVLNLEARSLILAALQFVDIVIIFHEETPLKLIQKVMPDILVKGKNYALNEVVGNEIVLQNGGKVITLDLVTDISTTILINKIKQINGYGINKDFDKKCEKPKIVLIN